MGLGVAHFILCVHVLHSCVAVEVPQHIHHVAPTGGPAPAFPAPQPTEQEDSQIQALEKKLQALEKSPRL